MKPLSVNILNFNGRSLLGRSVDSVLNQSYPDIKINIIDNASADGSVEFIKQYYPRLKLIENEKNLGYSCAHNNVIKGLVEDFVVILNPDVILDKNYIEDLVKAIQENEKIGAVQGKLLTTNKRLDSTGVLIKKNRRNYDRGYGEVDSGQYDGKEFIFGASGAAVLYRRRMLEEIKIGKEYFDEDFFMYREEVDLAWRAQLAGWKCAYVPTALAYHNRAYSPDTRSRMPERARQLQYRNRYLMIVKNELPATFIRHILYILGFEMASFFYVLFREPFLLKTWPEIIRLLPKMLKKRKEIMKKRKVSSGYILSIIK